MRIKLNSFPCVCVRVCAHVCVFVCWLFECLVEWSVCTFCSFSSINVDLFWSTSLIVIIWAYVYMRVSFRGNSSLLFLNPLSKMKKKNTDTHSHSVAKWIHIAFAEVIIIYIWMEKSEERARGLIYWQNMRFKSIPHTNITNITTAHTKNEIKDL